MDIYHDDCFVVHRDYTQGQRVIATQTTHALYVLGYNDDKMAVCIPLGRAIDEVPCASCENSNPTDNMTTNIITRLLLCIIATPMNVDGTMEAA